MNIDFLLKALQIETGMNIQFITENEYEISGESLTVHNGIIRISGTSIRVKDPRQFLFELKSERIISVDKEKINCILKTYHHNFRAENRNKTI